MPNNHEEYGHFESIEFDRRYRSKCCRPKESLRLKTCLRKGEGFYLIFVVCNLQKNNVIREADHTWLHVASVLYRSGTLHSFIWLKEAKEKCTNFVLVSRFQILFGHMEGNSPAAPAFAQCSKRCSDWINMKQPWDTFHARVSRLFVVVSFDMQ